MEFLYILENIRTPFLDGLFSVITHLGSETLFLAIALIIFWCVNKHNGYYLLTVGFFGIIINQFMKLVCQVPRPWVRDPNFTIVESARADAAGYSFPSGHTQNVVSVLGCPARSTGNGILRFVLVALILLTAFSRMYLGVHTPADVGVALLIGAVLIFAFYPLFEKGREKPVYIYASLSLLTACSLAYVLFCELHSWPADIDAHNLEEGVKNGYLVLGCAAAMLLSFFLERKYINFEVKASFKQQVLKVVLGLVLVLALKAGLKPLLNIFFDGHLAANAVRYFLLVVFAACVWPLSFPWFVKGCPMPKWLKKTLKILAIVILVLALAGGGIVLWVSSESRDIPVNTDNAANPLITPLGTTLLSGHRAGGGIAPENTMMALKNCVESTEYELDIFEFDIHLTADGIPVLLHDSTLDRTSDAVEFFGGEGVDVGEKTFAELKKLNMGEKFVSDSGEAPYAGLRGDAVPADLQIISLEEALAYLEANGNYRYIIEVKNGGARGYDAADKLYNTLKDFDCLERTVVGTFNNEVTAYMDSKYPDMPRSAGVSECLDFYFRSLLGLSVPEGGFSFVALQIPTEYYGFVNLGTSRLVNYAHANNIAVQYWTINDQETMSYLQSIGADAVMTDVPDQGAKVLVKP